MADHEDSTEDAMARSNAELDAFVRQLAGTRVPPAPNNSQHFAHVQTVAAIASPPAPSSPNMSIPNLPPQPRNSRQTMIRGVVPSTASASALADSQSSIGSRASQRIAPRTSTTDGAYGRGTASVPIVDIPGSAAEYAFNGGSLGNWSTEASTPSSTLERSLHHTGARSPSAHAQLLERSFSSISSSSLREEEGPEPTSTTTTTTATNATFTKPSGIRSPPAVLTPPPPGMPDIVVTQAASLGSTNKIQALAVPKGSDQNISTTPRNSQLISLTPGTTNGSSLASIATSIVTQDRAISPPNLEPEELDIDEDIVEVSKLRELRQLLNRKVHKLVKFVQESRTRIAMDPSFIFWQIFDGFVRIADIVNFLTIPVVISYACDILSEHVLCYLLIDTILIIASAVEFIRPRRDEFGLLLQSQAEKRDYILANSTMYRSFLALLPIDWIVLGIVMSKSGFPQCQNPTYVYDHVQTLSPMADFGPSALRYSYHPGDIPGVLSAYTWLRALRFLRLDKTLIWASTVKIPGVVEPVSRLLKILIITLVFAHLDSCAYWFLSMWIEDPRKWVKDYLILHDEENLLTPWFERYIKGLFASEKAMYFIMREVRTTTETIFQVFEMLLAAVLFGSIFGQLAVIVRLFDSQAGHDKAAKHRNYKREFLRRYMQEHAFPPVLQMKILNQEAFEWFHRRGMDTDNLFVDLPKAIRDEVNHHLYYELISSVPIFKEHASEAFKDELCQCISEINVYRDFYICKAGDPGTEMYFIRKGIVDIMAPDESKIFISLGPGSFFGEIALFENMRRSATAKTVMDAQLCVLKKGHFDAIIQQHPDMVEVFKIEMARRNEANRLRLEAEEQTKQREAERKNRVRKRARRNSKTPLTISSRVGMSSTVTGSRHSAAALRAAGTKTSTSRSRMMASGTSLREGTVVLIRPQDSQISKALDLMPSSDNLSHIGEASNPVDTVRTWASQIMN